MKIIIISILFCASLAYSKDTNITSSVRDSRDDHGRLSLRVEETYRGQQKILMTVSRPNTNGGWFVDTRCYLMNGRVVAAESWDGPDHKVQRITVYGAGQNEMEIFIRQTDGSMTPVSGKALEAYKKQETMLGDRSLSGADYKKLWDETQKILQEELKGQDEKK
jgi:hypothetical protein